jgi:hypothetical protein
MKEFFTRDRANEGIKVPLYHPDGSASEHWLIVRGIDSDEFRKAETQAKRNAIDVAQIKDEDERAERIRETELVCIASLIADWSFDEKCNQVNVVKLLREAPQIADMVNRLAARRADFFSEKYSNSTDG